MLKIIFAVSLIAMLGLVGTVNAQTITLTPESNEAKKDIITNMSNAVNHKYDRYDLIIGSIVGDNSTFTIYNKSGDYPIPPIVCGDGTHEEDGVCVPDTEPPEQNQTEPPEDNQTTPEPPEPEQNETTTTLAVSGDFIGADTIEAMDGEYNVALGDLGYKRTLDEFKSNWDKKPNHKCVIGNHDTDEDGSATIGAQSKAYCTDIWQEKIAGGTTQLIGYNTNGNLGSQLQTAKDIVANMGSDVKNLVLMSHKPCYNHPNNDHGVEGNVKNFCTQLEAVIPDDVNVIYTAGHEHQMAGTTDKTKFIVGGGGQDSHQTCGTGSGWDFCTEEPGYLLLEIDDDTGEITLAEFYNTDGEVFN